MISQEQIQNVVNIIVNNFHPDKIILFGSYASGTATEDSDLDLIVVKDTDLQPHKRAFDIWMKLKGILIPMDILVYTKKEIEERINEKFTFLFNALKNSRILYEC
ncbi:MAG: hypothetical protein A2046_06785 [Bacteroidetes bacterium GWA2_30_7]|nr:MAG: hypothetical protein A2046_06785 [Bacteroidetes bacterium GWA2_30_7]